MESDGSHTVATWEFLRTHVETSNSKKTMKKTEQHSPFLVVEKVNDLQESMTSYCSCCCIRMSQGIKTYL